MCVATTVFTNLVGVVIGNALNEELAAMGMGDWNEEENLLTLPTRPGSWSWDDNKAGQLFYKSISVWAVIRQYCFCIAFTLLHFLFLQERVLPR